MTQRDVTLSLMILIGGIMASRMLAELGEPQSVWLWRRWAAVENSASHNKRAWRIESTNPMIWHVKRKAEHHHW